MPANDVDFYLISGLTASFQNFILDLMQ